MKTTSSLFTLLLLFIGCKEHVPLQQSQLVASQPSSSSSLHQREVESLSSSEHIYSSESKPPSSSSSSLEEASSSSILAQVPSKHSLPTTFPAKREYGDLAKTLNTIGDLVCVSSALTYNYMGSFFVANFSKGKLLQVHKLGGYDYNQETLEKEDLAIWWSHVPTQNWEDKIGGPIVTHNWENIHPYFEELPDSLLSREPPFLWDFEYTEFTQAPTAEHLDTNDFYWQSQEIFFCQKTNFSNPYQWNSQKETCEDEQGKEGLWKHPIALAIWNQSGDCGEFSLDFGGALPSYTLPLGDDFSLKGSLLDSNVFFWPREELKDVDLSKTTFGESNSD